MQKVLKKRERERVLLLKENKLRSLEKHPFGWFVKKCISVCSLCWSVIRGGEKKKGGIPEDKNCQCWYSHQAFNVKKTELLIQRPKL